jgi:hypothetical protein
MNQAAQTNQSNSERWRLRDIQERLPDSRAHPTAAGERRRTSADLGGERRNSGTTERIRAHAERRIAQGCAGMRSRAHAGERRNSVE